MGKEKSKPLTEEQKELINFNKYLLLQFFEEGEFLPKGMVRMTIKSLSDEIKLSYRATHRRVESLLYRNLLISKKENKQRGKPVILKLNPKCKTRLGIYLRLMAKTPKEAIVEKEKFLSEPTTKKILKAIKYAGKPLNFGGICGKIGDTFDVYYLETLEQYNLIDIRYHITRQGSAFVQKKIENKNSK